MKRLFLILMAVLGLGLPGCGDLFNTPIIETLNPESGPPGSEVTITGKYFGTSDDIRLVTFNGIPVLRFVSASDTEIVLQVPIEASTGPVVVVVNNRSSVEDPIFTVTDPFVEGLETTMHAVTVADPGNSSIALFGYKSADTAATPIATIELASPAYNVALRDVLFTRPVGKIYATVVDSPLPAGDEVSRLLSFSGATGFTVPTVVDVGLFPGGMTASVDGQALYMVSTGSARLERLHTATDTLDADFSIDLSEVSFGFEPLNVALYPAQSTDVGVGDWVSVIGNNWFLGLSEVLTFNTGATREADLLVSHAAFSGLWLGGSLSEPIRDEMLFVTGDCSAVGCYGSVNIATGHATEVRLQSFDFSTGEGVKLPAGVASPVTSVAGVLALPLENALYVSAPGVGVLVFPLSATSPGHAPGFSPASTVTTAALIELPGTPKELAQYWTDAGYPSGAFISLSDIGEVGRVHPVDGYTPLVGELGMPTCIRIAPGQPSVQDEGG